MKLDVKTFRHLRLLTPVLDDILNAGEVEGPDQAVNLAALAKLCSEVFNTYRSMHPEGIAEARLDVPEPQ